MRAFRRDGANRTQAETNRRHPPAEQTRPLAPGMFETNDFLRFDLEYLEQAVTIYEPPLPPDHEDVRYRLSSVRS